MNDADIQRMFQQLDLILNLIRETRNEIKLLKQEDNDSAADPLIPNRQLAEILDLRPKSLQYYRKKKILEAVVIQRRVFFRQSVVKKFLAEHFNQKTDRTAEPTMPDAVYAHAFRGYLLQKEAGVYDDAAGRVRLPENRLQDF